ncbi:hypothetical protein EJ02DRAFT_265072 [Clathrospora elynae]|uniref:Uncharacterized protein n=1 Tax=Clathrospora elynae TaxID=706981 RepID=A0A6A5SGF1_9PLEO|nr:hypothetical protein EJ02DRAFT_265072 [Clathrospora elynae]
MREKARSIPGTWPSSLTTEPENEGSRQSSRQAPTACTRPFSTDLIVMRAGFPHYATTPFVIPPPNTMTTGTGAGILQHATTPAIAQPPSTITSETRADISRHDTTPAVAQPPSTMTSEMRAGNNIGNLGRYQESPEPQSQPPDLNVVGTEATTAVDIVDESITCCGCWIPPPAIIKLCYGCFCRTAFTGSSEDEESSTVHSISNGGIPISLYLRPHRHPLRIPIEQPCNADTFAGEDNHLELPRRDLLWHSYFKTTRSLQHYFPWIRHPIARPTGSRKSEPGGDVPEAVPIGTFARLLLRESMSGLRECKFHPGPPCCYKGAEEDKGKGPADPMTHHLLQDATGNHSADSDPPPPNGREARETIIKRRGRPPHTGEGENSSPGPSEHLMGDALSIASEVRRSGSTNNVLVAGPRYTSQDIL